MGDDFPNHDSKTIPPLAESERMLLVTAAVKDGILEYNCFSVDNAFLC